MTQIRIYIIAVTLVAWVRLVDAFVRAPAWDRPHAHAPAWVVISTWTILSAWGAILLFSKNSQDALERASQAEAALAELQKNFDELARQKVELERQLDDCERAV